MVRLSADCEWDWKFTLWTMTSLGYPHLMLCLICTIVVLITAQTDYTPPEPDIANTTWNNQVFEALRTNATWIINKEGENKTFNREGILRAQVKVRTGVVRIDYGSSIEAYCWPDVNVTSNYTYPSLLRIFELRPLAQAAARLVVMLTMITRMSLAFMRSRLLNTLSSPSSRLVCLLSSLSPWVVGAEALMAFWICVLHQDLDEQFKFVLPFSLVMFGIFRLLHMVIHILQDIFDTTMRLKYSVRFIGRALCLCLFVASFPAVLRNYLVFYERKICHPYVSSVEAVYEIICLTSIVVFSTSLIFDFPKTKMAIIPFYEELTPLISSIDPTYSPAFLEKHENPCISLSNGVTIKSRTS